MPRYLLPVMMLVAVMQPACRKNPQLGTVALDVYIHPESSSSDDVILQTAIRNKLEAVVLTGDVSKKEASDKAEQIARNTKVTIDNDKPIVAESVKNLIKVGN